MATTDSVEKMHIVNDSVVSDNEDQAQLEFKQPMEITHGKEAWLVVLGGFCALFVSFGWINGTGFFESYYQHVLLPQYSASTITWISSIGFAFQYLFAFPVGGLIQKFGCRPVLLTGSILHIVGLITMSFSTQYYQLLLSQGICSGLGSSAVFYAGVTTVSNWFAKRQALAVSISASGASLGGMVFPAMVTELIPRIGFGWTVRAAALVIGILLVVANLTVKDCPRPPPAITSTSVDKLSEEEKREPLSVGQTTIAAFKSSQFILTTAGGILFSFGYFVTLILLVTVATVRGVANPVYMLVILNASSLPGRIIPGALADKLGRYNIMCVMTMISAILTLTLYLPTSSAGAFIAYCITFGFSSASMVFLSPSLIFQISRYEEAGVRIGIVYSFISLSALFGAPIGGALLGETAKGLGPSTNHTDPGRWLILFCGLCQALGSMVFVAARWNLVRWKMVKV